MQSLRPQLPTEYRTFGDRIRYHFLFYFQAGNLEYLGLNPAWSNNILSIFSLVAMLALVMTLGFLLFRSRAVGRIAAGLFFFHGSLAYVPFLRAQGSLRNAWDAATQLKSFLPTGFPYRGEDWGMWSLLNFINQRHFASAIGIFLLTLCFLIERYRVAEIEKSPIDRPPIDPESDYLEGRTETESRSKQSWLKTLSTQQSGYIFIGVILGLLPMWNGAVFIATVVVLVSFLVFFNLRRQLFTLLATAAFVALPQIIYLKTGNVRPSSYSLIHWGYTITNPTIINVVKYLGFTFGFKWLLIAVVIRCRGSNDSSMKFICFPFSVQRGSSGKQIPKHLACG